METENWKMLPLHVVLKVPASCGILRILEMYIHWEFNSSHKNCINLLKVVLPINLRYRRKHYSVKIPAILRFVLFVISQVYLILSFPFLCSLLIVLSLDTAAPLLILLLFIWPTSKNVRTRWETYMYARGNVRNSWSYGVTLRWHDDGSSTLTRQVDVHSH